MVTVVHVTCVFSRNSLCPQFVAGMPALACINGMDHITFLVAVVIVTALAFDFTRSCGI